MAESSGKYDSDDSAFLDFGPEPIGKDVYDEVVNKELEAAREQTGKHKRKYTGVLRDARKHNFAFTSKIKKIKKIITLAFGIVLLIGVLYIGINAFVTNYYGDNELINSIKYVGYKAVEGYEDIDAFDCIDLDIDNCSVTVRSSYDDEFHISYKFIASKEDDVKIYVKDSGDDKVLTCDVNNKDIRDNIWNPTGGNDYEYEQYLTIMVPDGRYGSVKISVDGGYADIDDIQADEINMAVNNSELYSGISGVKADNILVTADNMAVYIRDSEAGSIVIKIANDSVSVYDSKIISLLDINGKNSDVYIDNVDVENGGKINAKTSGDDISVDLPGNPELYHIVADAADDTVYCSYFDYYEEGRYEIGNGDKAIELYNEDEGIFLRFEVDE